MKAEAEASEHDARALLALSKSLRDNVATLHARKEIPSRIFEAVEGLHAEALRAVHLVTCFTAMQKNEEREPKPEVRRAY